MTRFRSALSAAPLFLLSASGLALAACHSSGSNTPQPSEPSAKTAVLSLQEAPASAISLPRLAQVPTTLERRWLPAFSRQSPQGARNPAWESVLSQRLAQGWGEQKLSEGESVVTRGRTILTAASPSGRLLARFVHMADLHIVDDESPARVANYDSPGAANGALRPQEAYLCRYLNGAVRTINALDRMAPVSFVLVGGDAIDNTQTNELEWFLAIMRGKQEVACDSGAKNDPVPGPNNDGKDPFVPEGLSMPWKWVSGNHDVLVQGNVRGIDFKGTELGSWAIGGTRDYQSGGSLAPTSVPIAADPKRAFLSKAELMQAVARDGDGHGLRSSSGEVSSEFFFDIPGTPLRFLVLDTSTEVGGAGGLMPQAHLQSWIAPTFEKAKREHKWVITVSHHPADSVGPDRGRFGPTQVDSLTGSEWISYLASQRSLVLSLVGHSHRHRVRRLMGEKGRGFWEVTTGAIADYPGQFRLVEVWDRGPQWLSIRLVNVDVFTQDDPVAAEARRRSLVDYVAGYSPEGGAGTAEDRNVELWIRKP